MDYEQLISGMTDEDMREVMIRLLDHMRLDQQVEVIQDHIDDHVAEELYDRWSADVDDPEVEDEDEDDEEIDDETGDDEDGEVETEKEKAEK